MASLDTDIDTATGIFRQVVEKVAKDRQQLQEDKKKTKEEKQKWEEEKAKINATFVFHGQIIDLNVGGTRYTTSRSTLTKYPESMLGVMFSGTHDLEAMKCSDGSFFIDRDGARFKFILDYLRDGEEIVQSFPKSVDVLLALSFDAKYYQLDSLVTAVCSLLRDIDFVSQEDIGIHFKAGSGNYEPDGALQGPRGQRVMGNNQLGGGLYVGVQPAGFLHLSSGLNHNIIVSQVSLRAISYEHKCMKNLSFISMRFNHPVSFVNCNLSNTSFSSCSFGSSVSFKDCILDDTKFSNINGIVANVSFSGSKISKTNFDASLKTALQSAQKI